MKIQQTLQKSLEDWNRISGLDFCILDENNQIYITTCDKKLPSVEKLTQFREDAALCVSNRSCSLYKLDNGSCDMLLIVWGSGDSASTIGELAVCQIESLLSAYAEKTDKNSFMQNLLLDRYSQVEAFNKAAKLHISPSVRRAVFLVETKQHKDESAPLSETFFPPAPGILSQPWMTPALSLSASCRTLRATRNWTALPACWWIC